MCAAAAAPEPKTEALGQPRGEEQDREMPTWIDPTDVLSSPATACALVGVGAVIGVIGGMFGVGGGFLLTPVLMEIIGIRTEYAIGSASCHAVGIASSGLRRHLRTGRADLRLGLTIAVFAAVGAFCGSMIVSHMKNSWTTPQEQAWFTTTVRVVMLVTLGLVTFFLVKPARSGVRAPLQRLPIGRRWPVPGQEDESLSAPGVLAATLACGLASGFLGIGGGVLYLPLLVIAVGAEPVNAIRVSLIVVLCSAVGATIGHAWSGNVSLTIAMLMIVGSSLGVQLGAYLNDRMHARRFRRYFAVVVVAAMALVAWKLVRKFPA